MPIPPPRRDAASPTRSSRRASAPRAPEETVATLDPLVAAAVQLREVAARFRPREDSGSVHDLRVAARRCRALLPLAKPTLARAARRRIRASLKNLGGRLSELREWDVVIAEVIEPVRLRSPDHAGCAWLLEEARRARAAAGTDRSLAPVRASAARIAQQLTGAAPRAQSPAGIPSPPSARRGLAARTRALVQKYRRRASRASRHLGQDDPARLHRMRIEIKNLRYATRALLSLAPRDPARRTMADLEALQELLGHLNDCATARVMIGALLRAKPPAEAADAGAQMTERVEVERIRMFRRVRPVWRRLRARFRDARYSRPGD